MILLVLLLLLCGTQVDMLRLGHDLGLDGADGFFFAEISFAANLFTWAYIRLYRFPIAPVKRFFCRTHTSSDRNALALHFVPQRWPPGASFLRQCPAIRATGSARPCAPTAACSRSATACTTR